MVRKLKSYWPEIVFFLFVLFIGILLHRELYIHSGRGHLMVYLNQINETLLLPGFIDRSWFCFTFFWVGLVFAYLFCLEIFKNRKWSFLLVCMLLFNPALLDMGCYDLVQSPMMAALCMSLYFTIKLINSPSFGWAFLHAMSSFLAISAYSSCVVVPVLVVVFFLLNVFTGNIKPRELWKLLVYVLLLTGGWIGCYLLSGYNSFRDPQLFLPSSWQIPWYLKYSWILAYIPPLWLLYFLFSLVALNIMYFSHYARFLREKWIYTFLFMLLVCFGIYHHWFSSSYLILTTERYNFLMLPILLLGIGGCYEFSHFIRKKWGDKVYFIFRYSFLAIFSLQILWCLAAIIYVYPYYFKYSNWPLYFLQ